MAAVVASDAALPALPAANAAAAVPGCLPALPHPYPAGAFGTPSRRGDAAPPYQPRAGHNQRARGRRVGVRNKNGGMDTGALASQPQQQQHPLQEQIRFEHRHFTALHPSCNKLLAKRWEEHCRELHARRLRQARPTVDNARPRAYPHLEMRLKQMQIEEERLDDIERTNSVLLNRVTHQMMNPSDVSNLSQRANLFSPVFVEAGERRNKTNLRRIGAENLYPLRYVDLLSDTDVAIEEIHGSTAHHVPGALKAKVKTRGSNQHGQSEAPAVVEESTVPAAPPRKLNKKKVGIVERPIEIPMNTNTDTNTHMEADDVTILPALRKSSAAPGSRPLSATRKVLPSTTANVLNTSSARLEEPAREINMLQQSSSEGEEGQNVELETAQTVQEDPAPLASLQPLKNEPADDEQHATEASDEVAEPNCTADFSSPTADRDELLDDGDADFEESQDRNGSPVDSRDDALPSSANGPQ
ncbi:hypothetical protein HK405_007497 [Cladochytrium tenue]|nr:hypothetical protein HK405_007497 [Cladochytrium tenue]